MKYVTFSLERDAEPRLGVLRDDRVVDLRTLAAPGSTGSLPATMLDLIRGGPTIWQRVSAELTSRFKGGRPAQGHALTDIRWHAPIPRPPKNVMCVGRNYASHAQEAARARGTALKLPEVPMFFTKAANTIVGPFDDVPWDPSTTQQVDWEAELAVVIGVPGRSISRDRALEHVFGYTMINDVTARDLQQRHGQFFKGKSLDGFCPMGPCVVTADEFGDPHRKAVGLRVNGVVKQQGNTGDMIFRIDALIESLTHGMTLEPGDILATGTPDGVGFARTPPEFLGDGDILETEVEDIGTMRNRIVAVR